MKILFYGWNGYIGSQLCELLSIKHTIIKPLCRLGSTTDELEKEILDSNCDCILNSAGLTGRPNVDWCETNKEIVKNINLDAAVDLALLAKKHNIYHVLITTGCIYQYTIQQPNSPDTIGYTEDDEPNFSGSYYSHTKLALEQWVKANYLEGTLVVRLRMPIDGRIPLNSRNLLAKITAYGRVVTDAYQTVSILDNLLPILSKQIDTKETGIYNYVNPCPLTLNDILTESPYSGHKYTPISVSDLVTTAPRSWCILSPQKLVDWCIRNNISPPLDSTSALRWLFKLN